MRLWPSLLLLIAHGGTHGALALIKTLTASPCRVYCEVFKFCTVIMIYYLIAQKLLELVKHISSGIEHTQLKKVCNKFGRDSIIVG